ncbi:hypothetical protein Cpir12675_006786, partial [Ceratocystis pirilliformis]
MKLFFVLLIVTSASAIATSRIRSPGLKKGLSNMRYGSGMGASNRRDFEDVEAMDPRHERNAAAIGMVNRRDE